MHDDISSLTIKEYNTATTLPIAIVT